MKKKLSAILLGLAFTAGLCLVLYPTVSDWWNSFHQSRAIANYAEAAAGLSEEDYNRFLSEARAYNESLLEKSNPLVPTEEEEALYYDTLDVTGTGIMSYIEIPSIKCELPVYHGVSEAVLQVAVGHIVGTSLPIGGENTHCVLSGHRGLPSARLFTDLDQLAEGDVFLLQTLDETLTYEIDQIRIVEPQEVDGLSIIPGGDYCTLITCTPYGINSHRMLIRGHRVETEKTHNVRVTAEAVQVEPVMVSGVIAIPLLVAGLVALTSGDRRRWDDKITYEENSK